jgi:hypothetical protein
MFLLTSVIDKTICSAKIDYLLAVSETEIEYKMSQHQFIVAGDPHEYDPEKWASIPNSLPKRAPETHVNVLIVGAGFGGLMTALECWRKGHNVVGILERSQGPNYSGWLHPYS